MLQVYNLERADGRLKDISFSLPAGECLPVLGRSGAGKSLLLRALADLDPAGGDVVLDETSRSAVPAPLWRRRVTYMAADAGWWAPRVAAHFEHPPAPSDIADLMLPENVFFRPVQELSSGEQQRLLILRSLAHNPDVLLLDEPTSNLDSMAQKVVENRLLRYLQRGGHLMVVTHDPAQAARLNKKRALRVENSTVRQETVP